MKKFTIIILMLAFVLGGCALNSKTNIITGVDGKTKAELEEKNGTKFEWFTSMASYKVDKSFTGSRFWIETYKDGKMIDSIELFGGNTPIAKGEGNGFIIMQLTEDEETIKFFNTTPTNENNDSVGVVELFDGADIKYYGMTSLHSNNKPLEVKSGEEYIVSAAQFETPSDEATRETYLPFLETIMEYPLELEKVPYILLLKCEFIK